MNTVEEELQALRKELDAFRDENIFLYNELTKQNKTLCEEIISLRKENANLHQQLANQYNFLLNVIYLFNSKRLENHLTYLAGMQTEEFIVKRMKKLKAFNTREEHLKYALSQSNSAGGGVVYGIRRFQGRKYKHDFWH